MADIKFTPKARNANAVSGESFENGSMIVATDTGELYVDYNGARMRIGDVITLDTEAQRIATLAPLPKLYYVTETGKLWRFADDWVCVNPDDVEANMLRVGKSTFFNVANFSHNGNVYELLLKTAIYKGSGAANVLIRVHGHCGDSIVDFTVHLYWYNNSYTYRAAVNNGSIQPTLKAFSYTADKEYVGLAIIGLMYYPRLTVDMFDMWSINRNYDNNWTIEANTTSSATSIVPPEDLTDIVWQPIYSDIEANTIEANMIKADIVQADRWYYGVAKVSSGIPVYEIIVKTRIPVINQSAVNTIHLYGSDNQFVVDTTLVLYWQNTTAKFPWRHIINAGVRRIKAKVFTYEDNGTEYVGFALLPQGGAVIYFGYPRFSIDFCDIMSNVRDYSKDWTVELNTVKDSTSIIPQTNLMDCIESKINSDISGSATSLATPRTIALTGGVTGTATAFDGSKNIQIPVTSVNPNNLSNAVPVTKGGTGATSAANARAALEAGYTKYVTIAPVTEGWYRIASTVANIGLNYASVQIHAEFNSVPLEASFTAAIVYGWASNANAVHLSQDAFARISTNSGIPKVRIVYPNTGYGNKYAYLEIYKQTTYTGTVQIQFRDVKGWTNIYEELTPGEIPDGYASKELEFTPNAIVAENFVGSLTGTSTNSEQLAGVDGELYTCSYVGRIANESDAYYKNLDDAIRHGGYITSGTPGEINCPIPPGYNATSKLYGKLWVDVSNGTTGNSNNWVWQTWQSTTGAIYRRQQINEGDWTDWVAVATGGLLYPPDNAGINSLGTPTITEISCIPEMLADRLQFFPATKCMAETSPDGTSWTTKTVSASQWNSLLCCNPSYLAGLTWDNGTQLRLTFTYNTYVMLSMLYLYVATGSRLKVVVERYRNSTQDWVELASMGGIVGQPQHVSLWHDAVRFTNTANDSYSSQVRVTLIHEGNSTDTPRIDMLRWKGGYPAVNPNIYNWDPNKNVTFPMTVTAANFKGYWEWLLPAPSFNENSTSTIPTCKQIADYVKSLIGG